VVRPGDSSTARFFGEPFDLVWLAFAIDQDPTAYMPSILGAFYPSAPYALRFIGSAGASGIVSKSVTVMATGLDFVPVYEQAYFYSAAQGFVASNPRFVALLDD
jgi:hypothetical protein